MVSVYSQPNATLLKDSAGTVIACKYSGDASLIVINFASIISVVGMIPHIFPGCDSEDNWWFVVEKPGLDVARLGGTCNSDEGDDQC